MTWSKGRITFRMCFRIQTGLFANQTVVRAEFLRMLKAPIGGFHLGTYAQRRQHLDTKFIVVNTHPHCAA